MSYRLEQALNSMMNEGVVVYFPSWCQSNGSFRLHYPRNHRVNQKVVHEFKAVEPELMRWLLAGSPGLDRCFECPRSGECNNGSDCKFPTADTPSPSLGSSAYTPPTLVHTTKPGAKSD